MDFFKFTANTDFDFGEEPTALIKDTKSLTKRAAAKDRLKFEKTAGQEDIHLIALGAYEGTGFNRNMDAFLEKWCEKNAHYFKQADRAVNRNHKNKPTDPKYGNIKAAAYNPEMKRIELIVGLDKDKCADILDMQEKKGYTTWSMASKQAYDVCTWCNHKARGDGDRCEHIPDKLGEMNKEGQLCGMENPDPKWFEISYVPRQADRIGFSLQKVAGESIKYLLPKDHLQIYTGFTPPDNLDHLLVSKEAANKREILTKLSELEKRVDAIGKVKDMLVAAASTEKIAENIIYALRELSPESVFKTAADKGIIFNPENFAKYVFGERIKEADIIGLRSQLPGIYQELLKSAGEVVNNSIYDPCYFGTTAKEVEKLAVSHSLATAYVDSRLSSGKPFEKIANLQRTEDLKHKELAKQYVAYKLAALNYISESSKFSKEQIDGLTAMAVFQNYL